MNQKKLNSLYAFLMLFAFAALAATALYAETPQPGDVPPIAPDFLDQLKNLATAIAPEWLITISVAVLEFVGRVIKTKKPFSILYFIRDFFMYFAMILNALSTLLDRVLQRTKEKGTENPPPKV